MVGAEVVPAGKTRQWRVLVRSMREALAAKAANVDRIGLGGSMPSSPRPGRASTRTPTRTKTMALRRFRELVGAEGLEPPVRPL